MTNIDKFHEWVESQSPLALREYIHAQAAWQARDELDAVQLQQLEAKLDKAREALSMASWNNIGGYEGQQKWLELNRELDK
jgi:hypothetical protein